jgi:hypothetical protein
VASVEDGPALATPPLTARLTSVHQHGDGREHARRDPFADRRDGPPVPVLDEQPELTAGELGERDTVRRDATQPLGVLTSSSSPPCGRRCS